MSELKNETIYTYTSIVTSIYTADKKDFRLNPYRVFRELVFAIAILLKCITLPEIVL